MKVMPVILAVDHNSRNLELLSQFLGREGYQTRTATSLQEFDQALAEPDEIALALAHHWQTGMSYRSAMSARAANPLADPAPRWAMISG